jgi:hypothetical protein
MFIECGADLLPVSGRLGFQGSHFGQAAQVPLGLTELGSQKGFHQIPGHSRTHSPAAHAYDVHVIVLYALPGGEVVVDQAGPDARNLVGTHCGTHATAADGYPPFHLPFGHGVGKSDDEIGIVITGAQTESTEIYHLMACCAKPGHQFFLQDKPAVIGGYSHSPGQTESHREASLSFRQRLTKVFVELS